MTALILAAALCCAPQRQAFDASDVGHFIAPAILTPTFYSTALLLGAERKQARWIAAGLSVALVIAKEVYDERVAGRFGVEEAAIGVAGTAAGLWIAERIEWPEDKRINSSRMQTIPQRPVNTAPRRKFPSR